MTLHSAKGLEFPQVYLSGMDDGLFPGIMAISSDDPSDLEEERRLCYVGITRAKKRLTITSARQRMVNGETRYSKISRFVEEIPEELLSSSRLDRKLAGKAAEKNTTESELPGTENLPESAALAQKPMLMQQKPCPEQFRLRRHLLLKNQKVWIIRWGDQVRHIRFGQGVVLNIKDGGKDFEVTVCFDTVGVKKMFASFAKLKKVQ